MRTRLLITLSTLLLPLSAFAWSGGPHWNGRGYTGGWTRSLGMPANLAPLTEPECQSGKLEELNSSWRNLWVDGATLGKPGKICYVPAPAVTTPASVSTP